MRIRFKVPPPRVPATPTRWVRRRYVVAGELIRPVPHFEIEDYDPLAVQADAPGRRSGQLHLALADLDCRNASAVEAFTSGFGLLGLLTHGMAQAEFVPAPDGGVLPKHAPPPDGPVVREGWDFRTESGGGEDPAESEFKDWLQDADRGGLVLKIGRGGDYCREPLVAYFSQFFPDLPTEPARPARRLSDLPTYPALFTRRMWDEYCEPLPAFHKAVGEFRDVFGALAESSGPPPSAELRALSRHFRQAHPLLVRAEDGSLREQWGFASLLAAAYFLLHQELKENRFLRRCRNRSCGGAFAASRANAWYCSTRCQKAASQRHYREARQDREEER